MQWNLLVHGSNGQTARAEGNAPLSPGGRMEDIVRVVQTRDEPVRLPADVILARVGDQEVRLKVAD